EFIARIKESLPELPDAKKERFVREWGLSPYDAGVLVAEKETADFYEELAKGRDPKLAANWMTVELFGLLNKAGKDITASPVSARQLGGLLDLLADKTLSGPLAKKVLERMFETGR